MPEQEQPSLTLHPIGHVRTGSRFKFDAPSQPDLMADDINRIELLPGRQFELALQDLDGFDRIWLIWWFHRNSDWRPRVMPPRGPAVRRGVFATRSPHRPNPIGLTCVSLIKIEKTTLIVGPLDLVDGTPILDIKPYLRTADSFPDSRLGWIADIEASEESPLCYDIALSDKAREQLGWLLQNYSIDFTVRAFGILRRDPNPHRTRRILKMGENRYRIACGAWRMFYGISGNQVVIESVEKGYSDKSLTEPGFEKIIDREAQIAFDAWASLRW